MMKMYSKGYSLWIVPQGGVNDKFISLVKKLASENDAPVFQPHVTLLGDFSASEKEVIEKAKQLVAGQSSFTIKLSEIDYEDFHFRTLFVRAVKSEALLALHERAKEIFQMQNIPSYMPHMSILYGTFPVELREKIIQEIGKDQSAEFEVQSVCLVKGGEVSEWEIIAEFPLR